MCRSRRSLAVLLPLFGFAGCILAGCGESSSATQGALLDGGMHGGSEASRGSNEAGLEGDVLSSNEGAVPIDAMDSGPVTLCAGCDVAQGSDLTLNTTNLYWVAWLTPEAGPPGPLAVMTLPKAGGSVQLVASSTTQITGLAVDDTDVYFGTEGVDTGGAAGSVFKCAATGCGDSPAVLVSSVNVEAFAADSDTVYWSEESSIRACAKTGCSTPTTLVTVAPAYPVSIASDGVDIYFTTADNMKGPKNAVMMCPKTGCAGKPTTLASSQTEPSAIVRGGTGVYWNNTYLTPSTSALLGCALPGCGSTPTMLAALDQPEVQFAADAQDVYWVDSAGAFPSTALKKCAQSGCGGTPSTLATGEWGSTSSVAIDATNVYWFGGTFILTMAK
jgi:hypothetical protein